MNRELIIVVTQSGNRIYFTDPKGEKFIYKHDISNEKLGIAIRKSLEKSRIIEGEELKFYTNDNLKELKKEWEYWIDIVQKEYAYKNRREFLSHMNCCPIKYQDKIITIIPTNHKNNDVWTYLIQESKYIHLPETTPPAELGEALREGFRRCIGRR